MGAGASAHGAFSNDRVLQARLEQKNLKKQAKLLEASHKKSNQESLKAVCSKGGRDQVPKAFPTCFFQVSDPLPRVSEHVETEDEEWSGLIVKEAAVPVPNKGNAVSFSMIQCPKSSSSCLLLFALGKHQVDKRTAQRVCCWLAIFGLLSDRQKAGMFNC